jgi:hypothetical protein
MIAGALALTAGTLAAATNAVPQASPEWDGLSTLWILIAGTAATPVYLLCGSDELLNLRAALFLRGMFKEPRVFVRCFHRSPFLKSLADQQSFELLAFETVLREALREHYHETFRTTLL